MVTPNYGHTATLLPDGTVLVAGGGGRVPASCCAPSPHPAFVLPTAELYDPASGTWTATGDMKEVRNYHTATLLRDGKVLVASGVDRNFNPLASAELYDPASKSWTATSNLIEAHSGQTATLLPDGTVLLVGGGNGIYWFEGTSGGPEIADPELYDPGSGSGAIPSPSARMAPPAARPSPSLSVIEPAGPEWTATGTMVTARQGPTFTLLRDGKVLVFGGSHLITKELVLGARHLTSSGYEGLASADLYDPVGESWTAAGPMVTHAGGGFTATLLADGKVLVAGGNREGPAGDGSGNFTGEPLASAELFDPDSGAWTATGSMGEQRSSHTATLLPDGRVLVAGGDTAGWGAVASVELYDPASGTWTATASMLTPHVSHTATLLPDGKVLVVGGVRPIRASVELYDPASGTWTDTGSMSQPRTGHTATLLPDGTVLVAGGNSGVNGIDPLASVELYDPANRSWTVTGSMARPRTGHTATGHTATLLLDGRVLAVGGLDFRVMPGGELGRIISLASAELYDPASGSWTVTGNMSTPRDGHTAILLPDGRVLVAGGTNDGETLAYFELYDPRIATR
jgi:N-acetylneuraminic acid mutarotase